MRKGLIFLVLFFLITGLYSNELVWTGEPGYKNDGLEPEIAFSEGEFTFKIAYVNPKGILPKVVWVVVDTNRDGFLGDDEKFEMELVESKLIKQEKDKELKYVYEYTLPLSYVSDAKNDFTYFFAASFESQSLTTQLRSGPVIKPRLSFELSNTFWNIGTALTPGQAVTMGPNDRILIKNTGEENQRFSLVIEKEDIWPDAWKHVNHPDKIGPNKYAISGLFSSSTNLFIDGNSFNEMGNEDVITTTHKSAVGEIFGVKGYSGGELLLPEQDMALWLQLIVPTTSFGKYALESHDITLKVTSTGVQ